MNEDQSNIEAAKNLARIYFPDELMPLTVLDIKEDPETGSWALLLLDDKSAGQVTITSLNGKMALSSELSKEAGIMEVVIETPLTWERFSDALHTMGARHQIEGEAMLAQEEGELEQ